MHSDEPSVRQLMRLDIQEPSVRQLMWLDIQEVALINILILQPER